MVGVNQRNNGDRPSKLHSVVTFRQFVLDRWKAYTFSAKHQPSTRDCYNSLINNHVLPRFGDRALGQITPADISEFLESLQPKVSANTLQSFYSLLRLMFDVACEYDLIPSSPVRPKLHRPETAKVNKPTLTASQIRAVLEAMSESERLFALLVAVTGLRLGEALALRWMDFDPLGMELRVNHTLYRSQLKQPKTEGSRRPIRLVPAVAELLVVHKQQSHYAAEGDFIFCKKDGTPLNPPTIRNHLHHAMDAAGIVRVSRKHGFHIFRHTAGTLIYGKTRDLKLVQGALGHSNISTTSDIYVHLDDKVLAEGTEILAEEILGNCALVVPNSSKMIS
jgi:integrase